MSSDPISSDTADRHSQTLQRLAALGLELAEHLQARALAAETLEESARAAEAFHKVSRGLRQTLALELRVIRFRKALDRDALRETDRRARAASDARVVAFRKAEVVRAVEPLIYTEHEREPDEAARLRARFSEWLDLAAEEPGFRLTEVDELVETACEVLGLDPAPIYREAGQVVLRRPNTS